MPYEITDKTTPFSLAYGIVNLHAGNGKFVRDKSDIVGNSIQRTAQFALLMGVQHAVRKITYDGADIPSQNYQFYKGTPGQIANLSPDGSAPSFFPNDPNHWKDASKPGASFINIRYPVGMAQDGQPEKTVIQLDSTETPDYSSTGSVIDFGYSANPARAIAHAAQIITGSTSIIEFGAWDEYKAWCAELITITKNGQQIQIPRFRLDAFFTPPFTLKEFLNRVCQLTCSDWQERGGKIRMIPAKTRPVDFVFDHSNLSADLNDYEFEPINAKAKFNGVIATWRDLDDTLKSEGEPIIVDRRANAFIPKKFYQLNLGGCYRDQAERVTNYTAKVLCDLPDFAGIRASYAAYPVLPCDLVTVKHPVPAWNGVPCKVIKKKEKEDRSTTRGVELGSGYALYVRREPENPYSDNDFEPIQTRPVSSGLNPFAAPPAPNLSIQQNTLVNNDNTSSKSIFGIVTFGAFAAKQYAKIYWLKPAATDYELIKDVRPDTTNKAEFRLHNLPLGLHKFKAVAHSEFNVQQTAAAIEVSVTITASTFFVGEFNVPTGVGRALVGFDPSGNYTGTDTNVVPRDRIVPKVTRGTVIDNGINVDCTISGEVTGQKIDPASQGESIFKSYTEVYNKFGELHHTFEAEGFQGAGTIADGVYPRKYADAFEEAAFKILVRNRKGFSLPVYLYNGSTVSINPPTWKLRADCPLEVQATPLSANSISFSGSFNFSGRTLKLQTREIGGRFADWTDYVTGISAFPFVATGFPADKELEFRFVSSQGTNNSSNIVRAKTFQVGQTAPARPAPSGIAIAPRSDNPYQHLRATWTRNASDNTGVQIDVGGTINNLSANQEIQDFVGIGEGQSRTVRVRNTWDSGVPYSEWTEYKTGTTQVTPPPNNPPTNLQATYDQATDAANFSFNYGTDTEAHTLEESADGSNWSDVLTVNNTSFSRSLLQTTYQYSKFYRLRNNANGLRSNTIEVVVPIQENNGWEHPVVGNAFVNYVVNNQAHIEGYFNPQGGNGGFSVYYGDFYSGSQMVTLAANQTSFSFNVLRPFNSETKYIWVYRDDVYSQNEPAKYEIYIPGMFGGEQQ